MVLLYIIDLNGSSSRLFSAKIEDLESLLKNAFDLNPVYTNLFLQNVMAALKSEINYQEAESKPRITTGSFFSKSATFSQAVQQVVEYQYITDLKNKKDILDFFQSALQNLSQPSLSEGLTGAVSM